MQNNDFDVRAIRERLGLTPEAFAAELQVTEAAVRAWEAGALHVPGRTRQTMEYLAARAEWDAGMAASGLPSCDWLDARLQKLAQASGSKQTGLLKEVVEHTSACDICRERDAWARKHLPSPPQPPASGALRVLQLLDRLPGWARPAGYGAVALFLMTAIRLPFVFVTGFRSPMMLLEAVGVALLAAAAGAVGGFAFSLTRPPLARLGTPGDYLSGIVAVMAYAGSLLAVIPLLGGPNMMGDLPDVVIFAFISVLFGVIVGKFISDSRQYARPAG